MIFYGMPFLSFAAPCGPWGRRSTITNTVGAVRGSVCGDLVQSKPRVEISCERALAASRLAWSRVLRTVTPVSSGGFVPNDTGPSLIFKIASGSEMLHLAWCEDEAISDPNVSAS